MKHLLIVALALASIALAAQDDFEDWRDSAEEAWRGYEQQVDDAFLSYKRHIECMWAEFVDSTPTVWVEYGPDETMRSAVDFEQGTIELATLVSLEAADPMDRAENNLREQLVRVIGKTDSDGIPLLENQLAAPSGDPVNPANAEQSAAQLVSAPHVERIQTPEGHKLLYTVKLELIDDHLQERIGRYLPDILDLCRRFKVPAPLVMGVIHTESHFNPRAINRDAGAYGLMQIIPRYAGVTMNRILNDDTRQPLPEQLLDPLVNLEMGIGYLHYLDIHYFSNVGISRSRYYTMISAYNGGAANVFRTFTGQSRHSEEFDRIVNEMDAKNVFIRLTGNHPYGETRRYLIKVTSRAEDYGGL
ncbi:MAG: transglycosylase SLT domain-containing protein [Candidatus Cloacimonetes bacterium]|nr:transglycosylase SLT domain-containing protein [Candidatus Cloacimonadota bacterium]